MRIVVDTNVFVSSFFNGDPRKIIDLWKTGSFTLCLSKHIVEEYAEVLVRLGLGREKEISELYSLFAKNYHILFTIKTPELDIIKDDPFDNKFIECAVGLNADYIISDDPDLIAFGSHMEIEIVTPEKYLNISRR